MSAVAAAAMAFAIVAISKPGILGSVAIGIACGIIVPALLDRLRST